MLSSRFYKAQQAAEYILIIFSIIFSSDIYYSFTFQHKYFYSSGMEGKGKKRELLNILEFSDGQKENIHL